MKKALWTNLILGCIAFPLAELIGHRGLDYMFTVLIAYITGTIWMYIAIKYNIWENKK